MNKLINQFNRENSEKSYNLIIKLFGKPKIKINTVERRLSETSIVRNVKYPNSHFLRSTFKLRKISDYFTQ